MAEHEDKKRAPSEEFADNVDFESEDELGGDASFQAKVKKLKEELAQVKKERQEYLDGWQRCKADAINAKKDFEARVSRNAAMLREALVHDIIPALDSFDMAAESEAWAHLSDDWKSGMEQVRAQLIRALESHGILRFGRAGENINHSLHEIVKEVTDGVGESGTIVKVLRYGYKAGDKVLRPAQVFVKT